MASARSPRQQRAESWERFVQSSYPAIWRFCAMLTDDGAADDLAQETFLRATRALPRFRGDASRNTWLLSIARNVCADHLRARYRDRDRDTQGLTAREDLRDPSEAIFARDLLSRLDDERRTALVLTQLLGLTYEEAAAVCGCPVGTIRSRVARGRDDLIAMMGAQSGQARRSDSRG